MANQKNKNGKKLATKNQQKKETGEIEIKKKKWQKIGEQNLPTSPGPY